MGRPGLLPWWRAFQKRLLWWPAEAERRSCAAVGDGEGDGGGGGGAEAAEGETSLPPSSGRRLPLWLMRSSG